MKPTPPRTRPLAQTDLFDAASAPTRLASLQVHRDELVELLSQLLWQVASQADLAQQLEDDDDQDQS